MAEYFIIDVETVPQDLGGYLDCTEDERRGFLNPFDSRVIAAGIRADGENRIFTGDEKDILEEFWLEWSAVKQGDERVKVVGFNVKNFDLNMLVGRSFIRGATIRPFKLNEIVDLREKLSAYKWRGKGTLRDYVLSSGLEPSKENGSKVAQWAKEGDMESIKKHLKDDLVMTEKIFERAKDLNILQIEKW